MQWPHAIGVEGDRCRLPTPRGTCRQEAAIRRRPSPSSPLTSGSQRLRPLTAGEVESFARVVSFGGCGLISPTWHGEGLWRKLEDLARQLKTDIESPGWAGAGEERRSSEGVGRGACQPSSEGRGDSQVGPGEAG